MKLLIVCVLSVVLLFFAFLFWPRKIQLKPQKIEQFKGRGFKIYNYLNKPVAIRNSSGVQTVGARSTKEMGWNEAYTYFSVDKVAQISVEGKKYADYTFITPEGEMIKELHIGMITSRWVGADGDYNIGKPGLNAVQGLPWIKIHNETDMVLELNNNINISPGGVLRYSGRDAFGVRLGTVFKDQSGTFPDFIFSIPATDVYYGVVSDVKQALFGGFQLTPEYDEFPTPQYLLEEGWMGGPATGRIPYGFLPIEGPPVGFQDRWGQQVSNEVLKNPVGPPVDKKGF